MNALELYNQVLTAAQTAYPPLARWMAKRQEQLMPLFEKAAKQIQRARLTVHKRADAPPALTKEQAFQADLLSRLAVAGIQLGKVYLRPAYTDMGDGLHPAGYVKFVVVDGAVAKYSMGERREFPPTGPHFAEDKPYANEQFRHELGALRGLQPLGDDFPSVIKKVEPVRSGVVFKVNTVVRFKTGKKLYIVVGHSKYAPTMALQALSGGVKGSSADGVYAEDVDATYETPKWEGKEAAERYGQYKLAMIRYGNKDQILPMGSPAASMGSLGNLTDEQVYRSAHDSRVEPSLRARFQDELEQRISEYRGAFASMSDADFGDGFKLRMLGRQPWSPSGQMPQIWAEAYKTENVARGAKDRSDMETVAEKGRLADMAKREAERPRTDRESLQAKLRALVEEARAISGGSKWAMDQMPDETAINSTYRTAADLRDLLADTEAAMVDIRAYGAYGKSAPMEKAKAARAKTARPDQTPSGWLSPTKVRDLQHLFNRDYKSVMSAVDDIKAGRRPPEFDIPASLKNMQRIAKEIEAFPAAEPDNAVKLSDAQMAWAFVADRLAKKAGGPAPHQVLPSWPTKDESAYSDVLVLFGKRQGVYPGPSGSVLAVSEKFPFKAQIVEDWGVAKKNLKTVSQFEAVCRKELAEVLQDLWLLDVCMTKLEEVRAANETWDRHHDYRYVDPSKEEPVEPHIVQSAVKEWLNEAQIGSKADVYWQRIASFCEKMTRKWAPEVFEDDRFVDVRMRLEEYAKDPTPNFWEEPALRLIGARWKEAFMRAYNCIRGEHIRLGDRSVPLLKDVMPQILTKAASWDVALIEYGGEDPTLPRMF